MVDKRNLPPDMRVFVEALNAAALRAEKAFGRVSRTQMAKRLAVSSGSVYAYLNGTTLPGTEIFDGLLGELHIADADAKTLTDLRDAVEIARRAERVRVEAAAGELPPHADLPRDIAVLHGREQELTRILTITGDSDRGAVCVVSGIGGVGKTALVVRAARTLLPHYPDGCLFVDLHGYAGTHVMAPEVAAGILLRQMAIAAETVPTQPEARLALLRERLGEGRFLVVLDNALDSAHVAPLLPGEGESAILLTSRSNLNGIDDAGRVRVAPLSNSDSAALMDRLTDELPAHRLPTDAQRTAISKQCHGLPVAIRIASAILRSEMWPTGPGGDYATVDLAMLHDGDRGVETLFEYSLGRLPHDLARTFTLLGLHPGAHFDVDSGAALVGIERAVMWRHLRQLVEVSLLEAPAPGRYRFHDLLHVFAGRRAKITCDAATSTEALTRFVDYYTAFADAADRVLTPSRQRGAMAPTRRESSTFPTDYAEAVRAMTAERDNVAAAARTAFERGLDEQCWQTAFAVRGFAFITHDIELWIETHELAATAAVRADNPFAEAVTCNNLGLARLTMGTDDAASVMYERARGLFVRIGDRHGEHTAMAHQAWVHVHRHELDEALLLSTRALAYAEEHGTPRNKAILLRDTALIEVGLGKCLDAVPKLLEALEMFRAFNLFVDEAMAYNVLGDAYLALGDLVDAHDAFRRGIDLGRVAGSVIEQARGHDGSGRVAAAREDWVTAGQDWRAAFTLFIRVRDVDRTSDIAARLDAMTPAPGLG